MKGKKLYKSIKNTGCGHQIIDKPTHWLIDVNKIVTLLGFLITRNASANFVNVQKNFDLDSDLCVIISPEVKRFQKREEKPGKQKNQLGKWHLSVDCSQNWKTVGKTIEKTSKINTESCRDSY